MADEIKDLTGFYKWLENWKVELRQKGESFTTSKFKFAKDWWLNAHERRREDVPLPPEVEEDRRRAKEIRDSLDNVHKKLDGLAAQKKIDGWKFLRSIASQVIGDIDKLSK